MVKSYILQKFLYVFVIFISLFVSYVLQVFLFGKEIQKSNYK